MEVIEVLHMNGGVGDSSYANNSRVQKKVICMTMPITQQAITDLYTRSFLKKIRIADLGCSSGPNTLLVVTQLIETFDGIREQFGHTSLEFEVLLNDLPGNDFNTIFRSLPKLQESLISRYGKDQFGPCVFAGVPGSFYGRLFASNSMHFIHSSYSLQWLSQVPEGLESNKKNIYMASTSPPCVLKAYYEQFQRDFSMFLENRSEELVIGGRMVLTILGRRSDNAGSKECCYIWELLAMALNDMVSEGMIEEEKLDTFNIPQYTPSPLEVKLEVEKEGSFIINYLEASEVNWNDHDGKLGSVTYEDGGYSVAKLMRAVAEPLLVSHFGESIIDEVFDRYREIISDRMSKENTQFINVVVSLEKI